MELYGIKYWLGKTYQGIHGALGEEFFQTEKQADYFLTRRGYRKNGDGTYLKDEKIRWGVIRAQIECVGTLFDDTKIEEVAEVLA